MNVWPVVQGTHAAPISLGAADSVEASSDPRQVFFLKSDSGATPITADPQIDPGVRIGQEILLEGTSDTDYPIFNNGTGIKLNGLCNLKDRQTLQLWWDGTLWVELGRN